MVTGNLACAGGNVFMASTEPVLLVKQLGIPHCIAGRFRRRVGTAQIPAAFCLDRSWRSEPSPNGQDQIIGGAECACCPAAGIDPPCSTRAGRAECH